jgi:uncharacterized membrane protein
MNNLRQEISLTRWTFVSLFLLITVISGFVNYGLMKDLNPVVIVLCLFIAALLHGKERYGIKNIILFFLITWLVSHSFEALSIQTGFPFGHYYYDQLVGPRILQVPLIIMPGYFGTGYASWILAHIILDQYEKPLSGKQVFVIPLVATFIMVIWDVCMDPLSSTIGSLWVWKDGGAYFCVTLQNYFGWFLVVYIIFQLFALYLAKHDVPNSAKSTLFAGRIFWMEAIALYTIQGISQLMNPFTQTDHLDIYKSMALLSIFSMLFVSLIACVLLRKKTVSQ